MGTQTWTVAEAKAKSEGPQKITKRGRTTAVVVAPKEWERKGKLAEFLAASPMRRLGLKPKKLPIRLHRVEL